MVFSFFLQKILTVSQKNLPHKKIIIFPAYKVVGAKNYPRMYVGNVWTLLTFHDVFINVCGGLFSLKVIQATIG